MNKESILTEALAKATREERSRYLEEVCAANAALRSELESLIAAHDDAGSFLNRRPEDFVATVGSGEDRLSESDADAWQRLLQPADDAATLGTLGQYEVVELVGRGGMGVVLRARDPRLNRIVAIKLLAPELAANPMAVRRFLREAQAAAAVAHDHVVTIHAIDEQSRPPFLVMEFIDGQSLQQKIDRTGALDVKSILRIGMQTAAGLAAAHRQGLVHRDIKPANILLENGIERVKLSDFGLARAVDDIGMTRTGTITGTPQYMSPEQAQGDRVDHRTDLFSLGCVLYAVCTGRAAFRAESAVAVMHRVVHDEPKPIPKINPEVPEWLCEIVEKLLAKNPDDRFQTAAEVCDLLGRHLAHLQQPESVPQPERVRLSTAHRACAGEAATEQPVEVLRRLRFVRNVLGFVGSASLAWFLVHLVVPPYETAGFGITMPTIWLSLLTGSAAVHGAWNAHHRRSFGATVLGAIALLFPVNIPQMLGLFLSAWASALLWRNDVRCAFESEFAAVPRRAAAAMLAAATNARAGAVAPGQAPAERAWWRRIPIPAWIAGLLFAFVWVIAALDGANLLGKADDQFQTAEVNGVGFYGMACAVLVLWALGSIVTRIVRGPRFDPASMSGRSLAAFFGTVALITGTFVARWTNLDDPQQRLSILTHFTGNGSIRLRLQNPQARVEFNGMPVSVPADGYVVIPVSQPGSYMVIGRNESGWVIRSECLIHRRLHLEVGVNKEATNVAVTGPIRGQFPDEPSISERPSADATTGDSPSPAAPQTR